MNRKSLPLLVGGTLIFAVAVASPWVAICGVVFLWLVHGSTRGDLSRPVRFRSVAAGGIAGGIVASSAVVVMQLLVAERVKDAFIHIHWPAQEEGLISAAMKWTLVASSGISIVTALLLAWAITLVVDFLPRPQANTNSQ
jgi:hypothetical protein